MGRRFKGWENVKVNPAGYVDSVTYVDEDKPEQKYHNQPCVSSDGVKFQSKLERDYYTRVILPAFRTGEIVFYILQPSFLLAGNVRFRGDFLIVWNSHISGCSNAFKVTLVDTKGRRTDVYKLKRKLFNEKFPNFRITEIKTGDF